MKKLLFYILFALLSHQTTFLETENLKTSKSEKGLKIFQVFNFSDSQIQKDSQVLYYESQILLADSLYKNYLPQYNFDEVKAAVAFFDSLRLTTVNSQQTTDFVHKNKSQQLSNSASQNLSVSASQNLSDPS